MTAITNRRAVLGGMLAGGAGLSFPVFESAKTDEGAAGELRRFREIETEEEAAFSYLLATRPTTKASAIACVKHVADRGLATDEMQAWLAMLIQSPLVS